MQTSRNASSWWLQVVLRTLATDHFFEKPLGARSGTHRALGDRRTGQDVSLTSGCRGRRPSRHRRSRRSRQRGTPPPAGAAARRACAVLSPSVRSTLRGGPTQVSPAPVQLCAKSAFSASSPWPGWTAAQPVRTTAPTMAAASGKAPDPSPSSTTISSAMRACSASASSRECSATIGRSSSRAARITRTAIN